MINDENLSIEKVLEEKGEITLCSAGTSMYPMLRNKRDMVVIEKLDRKLKNNDVPLYRLDSGKLVLHRILRVKKNGYVIRGDNLYKKELNITDKNIIGVLKGFSREGIYYDCATSKKYKAYVIYIRLSYPMRHVLRKCIIPCLSFVKHKILKL